MDDIQKEAIRHSRIFLREKLIPEMLWDHLLDKDIFTDMMLEQIKVVQPRSACVTKLIDFLIRRPKEAYEDFITCLILTSHKHCAEEIKKNEIEARRKQGQLSGIPDNTPHNMAAFPMGLSQSPLLPLMPSSALTSSESEGWQQSSDVPMQQSCDSYVCQPSDSGNQCACAYEMHTDKTNVYLMESNPRGLIYIINNHKFHSLEDRNGTEVDCEQLRKLFSSFGYLVCDDIDLTAKDMEKRLKEFSKYEECRKVDSLIVVILSHGDEDDKIFGADGRSRDGRIENYITTKDLKSWFGNRQCPELEGKPKLFIIQACRGQSEDRGCRSSSTNSILSRDINCEGLTNKYADISLSNLSSRPDQSDMIFAHSSVPGHVSYRSEEGSVFINALVTVFENNWRKEHLADMLTMVNKTIVDQFENEDGLKCLASPVNQLTKKWFFNTNI